MNNIDSLLLEETSKNEKPFEEENTFLDSKKIAAFLAQSIIRAFNSQ